MIRYEVEDKKGNYHAGYSKELDKIHGEGAALSMARQTAQYVGGVVYEVSPNGKRKTVWSG